MNVALLNTNLAPGGMSAALVDRLAGLFADSGVETRTFLLSEWDLPACDGRLCYENERVQALTAELAGAEALVLVSPVYNYDLNAAAKNLIELTGSSWKGKAVGIVCSAGANRSYLAPLGFMNSLAIDYRCLVSPRYVYVTRADFAGSHVLPSEGDIEARLRFLVAEMPILAQAATRIAAMPRS